MGILDALADADATENETKIRATQKTGEVSAWC